MTAINLEDTKSHLRIDFSDEDWLIAGYIEAAQEYLEDYVGQTMDTIKGSDPDYPMPLKLWLYLAVGKMYENREKFDFNDLSHTSLAHFKATSGWGFGSG